MKKKAAQIAKQAAEEALERYSFEHREYSNLSYSTLTITFAEGSEPRQLSIPYQPYSNRTDISIPYRLVKVEE